MSNKQYSSPKLSIIIPVYNEAKNIGKIIKQIKKCITISSEILVIYDFESDSTIPVVKALKRRQKNIFLLKNNIAHGPSGAIRTGIRHARSPRVLVTMADLSDDIEQINLFINLVPSKFDIVCPSRYCKGGKQELNAPLKVGLPRLAGFLLKAFTGIGTSDPTNSFKLYSTKFIKSLSLTSTKSFSVTLEIMAKAHVLNKKILEVPTVWKDRRFGKTNFKMFDSLIFYFPWFCLALCRNRLFSIPLKLLSQHI